MSENVEVAVLLRTQQTSIKSVKQTTTDHDFRKKQTKNRPWSPKKQTSPGIIYCDHSSSDVINNWVKQRFNSVILDSENRQHIKVLLRRRRNFEKCKVMKWKNLLIISGKWVEFFFWDWNLRKQTKMQKNRPKTDQKTPKVC